MLWPEDAVYISKLHIRSPTNGVVAKIAAFESLQTAICLMAVRGDVPRVLELFGRFIADADSTFIVAAESNRAHVMKSLFKYINTNVIDYALGVAARSNANRCVRYLDQIGGMLAIDDRETLQRFRYHALSSSLSQSVFQTKIRLSKICLEWSRNKYDILVRAIDSGADHTVRELREMGFNNSLALACRAMRLGSFQTIYRLCEEGASPYMIADNLYLLGGNYEKIISLVSSRLRGVGVKILTDNLYYYVHDADELLSKEKIEAFIACGADIDDLYEVLLVRNAENRKILKECFKR